jgi:tRNA-uridine 2-sulfurtransferase
MCNKHVKFGRFLEEALARGADFVATGHYVKKTQNPKKVCKLLQAKDSNKDQSYFLYTLTQEQLVHCIFPLGNFIKPEVRKMAASYGLPNFAKKDSQGVCFLGEIAMADFLKHRIDLKPGKLMTLEGIVVGEHQGAGYYTIGQRHGLGSKGGSDPLYVVDKDMVKNIVYVAPGDDNPALFQKKLRCANIHWISGSAPTLPLDCCVRIRYRQPLQSCTVMTGKKRYLQVVFVKSQRAITPGQIVVFYRNKEMLGGGVIV